MQRIAILLELERAARTAKDLAALAFVMANDTRQVLSCDQVVVLDARHGQHQLIAVSHLSTVERHTPFAEWIETLANTLFFNTQPHLVSPTEVDAEWSKNWAEFSPEQGLFLPLMAPDGERMGALWLARSEVWDQETLTLAEHLAGTYAHAWQALLPRNLLLRFVSAFKKYRGWTILLLLISSVMFLPVRLSVLAVSEITAHTPSPITAPIEGVVQRILVLPNQPVKRGDVLVQFEDVQQRGRAEVAARALAVAQAEKHKANQAAFTDAKSRANLAELSAQVDLRASELRHVQREQHRMIMYAERDGVAVIADPKAWEGRPVRVGERLLEIADPQDLELTIYLPVMDALVIEPGAEVRVFLDIDPLKPTAATVLRAGYEPEMTAYGYPAYRLIAKFDQKYAHMRIGLRGTAKVYGPQVSLFYYLFRRPLTTLRQSLGW